MLKTFAFALASFVAGGALAQNAPAAQPAPAQPATTTSTDAAPAGDPAATPAANPRVKLSTTMGDIVIELYPDKAPKSVENFLQYVRDKHYDGTIFHRVINDFMVQGGGFSSDLKMKPTRPPIQNEANNGLSNTVGTVAMARTSEPNSANAQFFINVVDNTRLDHVSPENGFTWGYAVFGKVVEGMDTVEKIRAVPTGPGGPFPKDVPTTPVVITTADVLP